jgi:hypothetical protein
VFTRNACRSCRVCVALWICLVCSRLPLSEEHPANKAMTLVKGRGCVERGVETSCLILTDLETRKEYNLFFNTNTRPGIPSTIAFEGTIHKGPTICMQGKPIDVHKWIELDRTCHK